MSISADFFLQSVQPNWTSISIQFNFVALYTPLLCGRLERAQYDSSAWHPSVPSGIRTRNKKTWKPKLAWTFSRTGIIGVLFLTQSNGHGILGVMTLQWAYVVRVRCCADGRTLCRHFVCGYVSDLILVQYCDCIFSLIPLFYVGVLYILL